MKIMMLREVSERTRVPEATLRYWRHLGSSGPKSFSLGKRVVYSEDDVEQWIADQYAAADSLRPAS